MKKPTVCMIFDTVVWDESYFDLRDLLKEYGMKVGFSIDPTGIGKASELKGFIKEMAENGHEILVHTPPCGPSFLADCTMPLGEIEIKLKGYREAVMKMGYSCDGLILAGGKDSNDTVRLAAMKYYEYCQSVQNCCRYAYDERLIPYNTDKTKRDAIMRTNMEENNVKSEDVIAALNRCIDDNGMMVLYAHNYNTPVNYHVKNQTLRAVLDALKAEIENSEIYYDTPMGAISYYYG